MHSDQALARLCPRLVRQVDGAHCRAHRRGPHLDVVPTEDGHLGDAHPSEDLEGEGEARPAGEFFHHGQQLISGGRVAGDHSTRRLGQIWHRRDSSKPPALEAGAENRSQRS